MSQLLPSDEDLVRRLPLPLAQLYRRAHNAKTALERHQAAYYLWEAALKLLGSVAVVEYAGRSERDAQLDERLQNLARPSVGHWWEFVRRLVPVLADAGDGPFQATRDLLLGRTRDDLPRTAGLDAALGEALDGRGGARTTVRLTELFDRLVRYRNREVGHGAAGQRSGEFYERVGRALLAGITELLARLDVLAGRRLLYVADVRCQASGQWLIERYELAGETARRVESLEMPQGVSRLPLPERIYLDVPAPKADAARPPLQSLHPLAVYDAEAGEMLFLNARRGRQRTEYLCYSSGRVMERKDLGGEQRELLARILGSPVDDDTARQWAARSQAEESTPGAAADEPAALPSRQVGEFELLSELGRGGMGVVYRAWQPSLGRQVALKCMFQSGDPKAEARFAREIRALGRVENPHLVKIFTSGSEGDQWFYAMELIEGATLAAVCDRLTTRSSSAAGLDWSTWQEAVQTVCQESRKAEKPLSTDRPEDRSPKESAPAPAQMPPVAGLSYVQHIVELVRQVAGAVHALHETGVIHRDIKPGNIMVVGDGSQAVLMDLGLAQVADEVQGRLTRTRQFVGTLRYASPEQVLAVGALDRRSDVYSLGGTLWELLTLRPLFGATEQTPTPELMQRIQYEEPERLRKYHPGIAADLEAIVHKCLEKDPKRRYATAHDLAEDLARWQQGKPVSAQPPTLGYVLGKYVLRHRLGLATAAGLVLAALLGTVFAVYRINDARLQALREKGRAEEALGAAEAARAEADQQRQAADQQREEADRQRARAEWQKTEADQQRLHAEEGEVAARRSLYATQIDRAYEAWHRGEWGRVVSLLDGGAWRPARPDQPDLRGWEWYYLRGLCNINFKTLQDHADTVNSVAFSPDGRWLASGSADQTVKIWDAATGRLVSTLLSGSPYAGIGITVGQNQLGRTWIAGLVPGGAADRDGHLKVGDIVLKVSGPDGKMVDLTNLGRDEVTRLLRGKAGSEIQLEVLRPGEEEAKRCTLTRQEVASTVSHTAAVTSVAFSPDGKQLASASYDQTIKLWDVAGGKEVRTLKGHRGTVQSVAFSPDGRWLASAGDDHTVKLWDVAKGEVVRSVKGYATTDRSVAFSPDGHWLAVATEDQAIQLWDVADGKEGRTFKGHVGNVQTLAFSADGSRLASAAEADGLLRLWDTATGQEVRTFKEDMLGFRSIAFSPDGRRLARATMEGTVKLWDTATGKELPSLNGHTSSVYSVAFRPDGRRLASASVDQTIKLWALDLQLAPDKQEAFALPGAGVSLWNVAFRPDGKQLTSLNLRGAVTLWDATTGQAVRTFPDNGINGTLSPDGRWLAAAEANNTIQVTDVTGKESPRLLKGHTQRVSKLVFSPGGLLASASLDGTVRLWDVAGGREVHTLKTGGGLFTIAFSPDGKLLASSSQDGLIRIWDPAEGKQLHQVAGKVMSLAFPPDGRLLALGYGDGTVGLWPVGHHQAPHRLKGHLSTVFDLVFSPDGRRLASASMDGTVKIWDVAGAQDLLTLRGHTGLVTGVAFSPDGWRLASSGFDQTIKLWDAALFAVEPDNIPNARRGFLLAVLGQWDEAVAEYSRVIDKGGEDHQLWFLRGFAYAGLRQWDKAVADYSRAIDLKPEDEWPRYLRANAYAELEQWDKAEADFTRVTELRPESALAWHMRGLEKLAAGDPKEYQRTGKYLLEHFGRSQDPAALNAVAWGCLLLPDTVDNLEGLIQAVEKVAANDPKSYLALNTLEALLYRAGHWDKAAQRAREAIEVQGKGGLAYDWLILAMAEQRLGHGEEAKKWLDKAVSVIDQVEREKSKPQADGTWLAWGQRLALQMLRREAEGLIQAKKSK